MLKLNINQSCNYYNDLSSIDNDINTLYNQYSSPKKNQRLKENNMSTMAPICSKTRLRDQEEQRDKIKKQKEREVNHKKDQHLLTLFNVKKLLAEAKEEEIQLDIKKRLSTSCSKEKRDYFLKTWKNNIRKKNKAELDKLKDNLKEEYSRYTIENNYECKSKRESCALILNDRSLSVEKRSKGKYGNKMNSNHNNKNEMNRKLFNEKVLIRKIGHCVYLYEENAQMMHNPMISGMN